MSLYNGIHAIPVSESFQVINLQTNETDIHQDIFYYTLPTSDRRLLGIESDLSLRNDGSTSTKAIPDIALSGSTGEIGEYVSIVGKISQRDWSVASSNNNTSVTTFITEYLNSNNIADIKERISYKIDETGNIVSMTYIHTLEYIPWTRTLTATPN